MKNGNLGFVETGLIFRCKVLKSNETPLGSPEDECLRRETTISNCLYNLSRFIFSSPWCDIDRAPIKIVTLEESCSQLKGLTSLLQDQIKGESMGSITGLNSLLEHLNNHVISLVQTYKDNISEGGSLDDALKFFAIRSGSSSIMNSCSTRCDITSQLFRKMFIYLNKKREYLKTSHLDDSIGSLDLQDIDFTMETPEKTPKPSPEQKSSKKRIKIKAINHKPTSEGKKRKGSLLLASSSSPEEGKENHSLQKKTTAPIFKPPKKPKATPVHQPQPLIVENKPVTTMTNRQVLSGGTTTPFIPVTLSESTLEQLLQPRAVSILHYFCTCKQKSLESFFKHPKSKMILGLRPFLSMKDLIRKFAEQPYLGLASLHQFCKVTFSLD